MRTTIKKIATVLLACVMTIGLGVAIVGCSGGQSDEQAIKAELDKELGMLKNPTEENLKTLLGDNISQLDQVKAMGIDPIELIQHMFAKFDYSVGDVKVDGDTATAKLTLTNVDLQSVMNDVKSNMTSDSEFVAKVQEAASSGDMTKVYPLIFEKMYAAIDASDKLVTSDVEMKLDKKDGQWTVNEDNMSDIVSSMYGGLDMSAL